LERELDFFRPELVLLRLLDALPFRAGTLAPFFRASDRPMATACFRLFTFPPRPPFPRRRVPALRRRMALATDFPAALLVFRRVDLRPDDFFAAISSLLP
jgi:hypothetical protein